MTMIAYHGDDSRKAAILDRLQHLQQAKQIVPGILWESGQGRSAGFVIHDGDYAEYETLFGIPRMLARFADVLFDRLPRGEAETWPVRFMSAIPVGADLSRVCWELLYKLVVKDTLIPTEIPESTKRRNELCTPISECAAVLLRLASAETNQPVEAWRIADDIARNRQETTSARETRSVAIATRSARAAHLLADLDDASVWAAWAVREAPPRRAAKALLDLLGEACASTGSDAVSHCPHASDNDTQWNDAA